MGSRVFKNEFCNSEDEFLNEIKTIEQQITDLKEKVQTI